jgi:hypothetical protein
MIKVGNRVSLFHNIGKEGHVIKRVRTKIKTSFEGGTAGNGWKLLIVWDDGTETLENIDDVMRID